MSEEKQAWWARAVMIGGVFAIVALVLGPLGYRLFDSLAWLGLAAVATLMALLTLLVGIICFIIVMAKGRRAERGSLTIGSLLSVVVLGAMLPFFLMDVPPIHNISTDTQDPPQFDQIVAMRGDKSNPLEYDAETLAPQQQKAYPDVKTLTLGQSPDAVVTKAGSVLEELGIEVVNVDAAKGIVEGTATTRWFGFKDDVVVRVRPSAEGSIVDVRSVSRVGQSDLGANAKRILAILAGLQA